jgi:cation diffusion facilitator CzcD-associated flavoprotein CzcO
MVEHNLAADALREKYRQERDKRLRSDGVTQYIPVEGSLLHLLDDPYVEPGFSRDPIRDEVDAIVIGGGFSGLLASARLRQQGVAKVRIIDKAGDFGGTWYWNRYPGAACDVESYIYMPLLEETGTIPTEKYAKAPEILAHCQRIGRHFGLYENACFQTQVTEVRWDESARCWIVRTDRDDVMRARYLCIGSGPLSRPKLPRIPGIERFRGHSFHTSRWDYGYTGGSPAGDLTGLADKRVAIIGTGATSVQIVPHLAASAKQVYVVQRTPSVVDVRANRPTDPVWASMLEPGWQKRRQENFESVVLGMEVEEDLVGDGWTEVCRQLRVMAKSADGRPAPNAEEILQRADDIKMEQVRNRVGAIVKDSAVAESLRPYYNLFCKRPCFHDEYLEAFNRETVQLIDTQGRGLDEITEDAILFDGVRYPVDCIVYATGFEVAAPVYRAGRFEIYGRDGLALSDKWDREFKSLHGIYTHGFPNLFVIGGIRQASITINIPYIIDQQCKHIARVVAKMMARGTEVMEVTTKAEDAWVETIKEKSRYRAKFFEDCTPGYYNNEGSDRQTTAFSNTYGDGPFEYIRVINEWVDRGMEQDTESLSSV